MKTLIEKEKLGLPQEVAEALEKVKKMDCELIGKIVLEGMYSIYGREGAVAYSEVEKSRSSALEVEKFIYDKRDIRELMTIEIIDKNREFCGFLEVNVSLRGMEEHKHGEESARIEGARICGGQRPIVDFLPHCAEAVMSGKTRYVVAPYYDRKPDEKELLVCKVLRKAFQQNKLDKENFNPDRGIKKSAREIVESARLQTKPARKTPEFADMTKKEQEKFIRNIQSLLLPSNQTFFWNR